MANTYTQIHIHLIIVVESRDSLIKRDWEIQLHKYVAGILQNHDHKLIAINGTSDHIHILFGMRPNQALSELVRMIKSDTTSWINQNQFIIGKFSWQKGYAAFSYSKSQVPSVARYIEDQKTHHTKVKFIDEYKKILTDFNIQYDERYIFKHINSNE